MRGLHGTDKVRLLAILREPAARMHSAYWFWPQYRRRYGHDARGFVKYVDDVVPAFKACLAAQQQCSSSSSSSSSGGGGGGSGSSATHAAASRSRSAPSTSRAQLENEGGHHADQLLKSLYAAYVPTWLRVWFAPPARAAR